MAQRVVDVLEVVEVEQAAGDDLVALETGQGLLQALVEALAIGRADDFELRSGGR